MSDTQTLDRDIVEIAEAEDPAALYTDEARFTALLDSIRSAVGEGPFDMGVKADREHLRSAAAKIAKVKTRVDAAGSDLKAEAQKRVDEINGFRRRYKGELQELQDGVRAPLTEWEQAEKARQERVASILNELKELRDNPAPFGATADDVEAKLADVLLSQDLDSATFGDQLDYADKVKNEARAALRAAVERLRKEEAERAELEALRREKAEREERERKEVEARQRAEEEARRAKEAEERAKRMAEEAAEKARQEERERIERERERAELEARREQEAAEAKARAEAEAEERRAANKRHRAKVMKTAAEALAARGLSEEHATAAVAAIAEGRVPGVTIQF